MLLGASFWQRGIKGMNALANVGNITAVCLLQIFTFLAGIPGDTKVSV